MNQLRLKKTCETDNIKCKKPQVKLNFLYVLLIWLSGINGGQVLARPDRFNPPPLPPNPLEVTIPDPLLPNPPKKNQSLSAEQRQELAAALEELNAEATAQLAAGNTKEAFNIWYRELRLRRYLGPLEEVRALTRVGTIAWEREQITQVQIIDQRLKVIYQEYCMAPQQCELALLQSLGTGFEVVRSRDLGIKVYQQILADARTREDFTAQEAALTTLGRLSLEKLDYPNAALAYEELLTFAERRGDREREIAYVRDLAFIYTQARQLKSAIRMRQRLVTYYINLQDLIQVPELKVAIANDYQTLNELEPAIQNYEEAYQLAWTLQQFSVAREALEKLAKIYQSIDKLDAALQVYEALLIVDRRGYNLYGIMNSYDKIGEIHLQRQAYPEALIAFQNGLEIAQQVQHQEAYFTNKIDRIIQKSAQ